MLSQKICSYMTWLSWSQERISTTSYVPEVIGVRVLSEERRRLMCCWEMLKPLFSENVFQFSAKSMARNIMGNFLILLCFCFCNCEYGLSNKNIHTWESFAHLKVSLLPLWCGKDKEIGVASALVKLGGIVQVIPCLVRTLVDQVVLAAPILCRTDADGVDILKAWKKALNDFHFLNSISSVRPPLIMIYQQLNVISLTWCLFIQMMATVSGVAQATVVK